METPLEKMTFEELVAFSVQQIHLGLLEDGGKGLRTKVWLSLQTAIRWNELQGKTKILK
jgi:hypothetical protein